MGGEGTTVHSQDDSAVRATGFGSWPGTDPLEACRVVVGELGTAPDVPYLPELPERGPGADPVGRTLGMLVDLPVDLQPSGWRLVERPGRDLQRARSMLTSDVDAVAEACDGRSGALRVRALGPWTLAGSVWLPRGERIACDPGAARDLADSLAEGLHEHLRHVQRLLPATRLLLQLDEPGLPAALAGRLPTASGFGRLRAVDPGAAEETLRRVVARVREVGSVDVEIRCAAAQAPLPMLRRVGPERLGVSLATLTPRAWEGVAVAVEAGTRVSLGVLDPALDELPGVPAAVGAVLEAWRRTGLELRRLTSVDVCADPGLAPVGPVRARQVLGLVTAVARALDETARD